MREPQRAGDRTRRQDPDREFFVSDFVVGNLAHFTPLGGNPLVVIGQIAWISRCGLENAEAAASADQNRADRDRSLESDPHLTNARLPRFAEIHAIPFGPRRPGPKAMRRPVLDRKHFFPAIGPGGKRGRIEQISRHGRVENAACNACCLDGRCIAAAEARHNGGQQK